MIGTGAGVIAGRVPAERFADQFAQVSGLEHADGNTRAVTIMQAFQTQADTALQTRSGIGPGDLPFFYEWARAGQLQEAFQKQARMHDVSGYKDIASKWKAANDQCA